MNGPPADRLLKVLESGLCVLIFVLPLPFGAVTPGGRAFLESTAALLIFLWLYREWHLRHRGETSKVPVVVAVSLLVLLFVGFIQVIPIGDRTVSILSPAVTNLHALSTPRGPALLAESSLLQMDPGLMEQGVTLSLSPGATASALRTGAALAGLLLVACSVAAGRGATRIAWAIAISAAFQGVYGVIVLLSGADMIWNVPKKYFLDCATGSFVNRGHYATFLAMALAPAIALALQSRPGHSNGKRKFLDWFKPAGGRNLLLRILILLGMSGLLLSFSRTGIVAGLLAGTWIFFRNRTTSRPATFLLALVVLLVLLIPLAQYDPGRLVDRYSSSMENLTSETGRLTVWKDSLEIFADFPIFGTGLGTFAEIYPGYRSPQIRYFFAHAHNDFLQFAVEAGFLGIVLLLALIAPIGFHTFRSLGGRYGPVATGFGAGLAVITLHSLVDFPFHIPAIAAMAAIQAGVLLGLTCRNTTV
jgi:O-antigen ligase